MTYVSAAYLVAPRADVEVHPVPVEVLVLLSLELDPRHLEVADIYLLQWI
jgi:hypothetical protein